MELQFSQYQQTPVPSTDKVCSALRYYRNIDPLGRRHENTWGFPHEMSATDSLDVCWWAHVSNAEVLQRSGLSTIGDILRHRRLSPFGHVARLDHGVLCVWWWIPTKAERPGVEDRRVALATSIAQQRSNTTYAVEIWDRQGSRSGAMATRTTRRRWCDDDDDDVDDMMIWWWYDDEWLVSKMKGKTNFSRHLQTVRNRDCWMFENHWRRV